MTWLHTSADGEPVVQTALTTPLQYEDEGMKRSHQRPAAGAERSGKIKYGALAWLLGLPLPIILIALFYGGCDF
jgi:hypothetical protein